MKATEKTLSIKHNMFWNTVGSLTNLGCQWLITILVVRLSDGYSAAGIYSLAMSIFNMFSQLAQYRMYTVQIADVERKNSAGEYLTFRFFTTFIAFAMLAVYSIATCRIGTVPAILLYALYKTAGLVIDVMHANDQVGHRMDYIGKSLIMQGIGSFLSFILVFGFFNSLEGALLLMTVVTIGIGVIYDYPRSNRISAIKLGISRAKVRAFLCSCLPIVLGGIAASAAPNIPRQYLSYSFGDSALGIYASVAAPVAIIQMGATYIYNPLLGYLVERYHSREKSFFSLIGKILAGIFFVGVISSVALFFFGKLLLSLFYGAGIAKHTDLLQPMLACAFLTGIAWFVNDLLVSLDNYRGVFVGSMLSLISAVAVMAPAQMLFGLNGPTVSALISNAICLIYQSSVLGKQTQQWFGEKR